MATRAIVADDHPMCREMAKLALAQVMPGIDVVEAATLDQALAIDGDAAIIILDLGLPDSSGVASLIDVARRWPDTPILVVSGSEGTAMERRIAASGSAGFVAKSAPVTQLIGAMRAVLAGETAFPAGVPDPRDPADDASRLALLSAAESRVLRAMRSGRLNKQIAHDLGLSEITVKQHVKAILRKLGVVNRTQAILMLHGAPVDASDPNG